MDSKTNFYIDPMKNIAYRRGFLNRGYFIPSKDHKWRAWHVRIPLYPQEWHITDDVYLIHGLIKISYDIRIFFQATYEYVIETFDKRFFQEFNEHIMHTYLPIIKNLIHRRLFKVEVDKDALGGLHKYITEGEKKISSLLMKANIANQVLINFNVEFTQEPYGMNPNEVPINYQLYQEIYGQWALSRNKSLKEKNKKLQEESKKLQEKISEIEGKLSDLKKQKVPTSGEQKFLYDIAISFAGEDRVFASKIANSLLDRGIKVFYDDFEKDGLWGKDLYSHLAEVYEKSSRYCLMIISKYYVKKDWTNHERRHAQARAFKQKEEYILPLKLDTSEVPGLPSTISYIKVNQNTTTEELVQVILNKIT